MHNRNQCKIHFLSKLRHTLSGKQSSPSDMAGRSPAGSLGAGLREPLGGGRAPSARPMPRSGEATGWAGHTQHNWPQATDQKHCAKRLTNVTVQPQPQVSQLAARRARKRPGSANGCATVPSEGNFA